MVNSGYLIVLKPSIVIGKFEEGIRERGFAEEYKKFREVFSKFKISQYYGISRNPLMGIPEKISSEYSIIPEPEAQFFMWVLEENGLCQDDLIFSYEDMVRTFNKIKNINDYDVIFIRKVSFENNDNLMGFDIGYWGGDHFSIIADTIITPTWHGPLEEDYLELAERLKLLNENLLFGTSKEAEKFKQYYKSKTWAETELYEGEFYVIQVDKVLL